MNTGGNGADPPDGDGGLGAGPSSGPICGDGIPEGEAEQCDERGGTQFCTVDCQFRNRVTDGLILFYTFQEGAGDQIFDRSGFGAPLNLTIPDTSAISWHVTSLDIEVPVLISSGSPATKLIEAVQGTSGLTVEAWVAPAATDQDGPARIFTISDREYLRNLTLGQDGAQVIGRVRTSETGPNAFPEFRSEDIVEAELTHLVFFHGSDGEEAIFVNGEERVRRNVGGDFSSWDASYRLALGAEFNSELSSRDFLGTMHLIAMYSRALSGAEILQNFLDGP